MSKILFNRTLWTTLYGIKFSRNIVTTFSLGRLECLSRKSASQLPYLPMINNYSTSTSLIHNEEDRKEFLELNKELKTYDAEQILTLVTSDRRLDLDPTHLAICMKRLYTLHSNNEIEVALEKDPRLMRLLNQLVISARHLSAIVIADMIRFSHALNSPYSHQYALLKLCTNVSVDLPAFSISDLTNVMTSIVDDLQNNLLRNGDMEWSLKLTNQIEVMMKCLLLLAETKSNQFKILTVKSRIDLILAFGNNLSSLNSLLFLMLKDFKDFFQQPEELIRLVSASLICLSSYPSLSPVSISSTHQTFPSFMNIKFSRFKNSLVSMDASLSDRLLKGVNINDTYDKLCEGFDETLLRERPDKSLESQKVEQEIRVVCLTQLLDRTLDAFYRLEDFKIKAKDCDMLLTACSEFLRSNPANSQLILQCLNLVCMATDVVIKEDSIDLALKTFSKTSKMRYFPQRLISVFMKDLQVTELETFENHVADFLCTAPCDNDVDEVVSLIDNFMAFKIIGHNDDYDCFEGHEVVIKQSLDKIISTKHQRDLDSQMKVASYMISNGREPESVESIFEDLKSNQHQIKSDEFKTNTALMFLTCVENSMSHPSLLPLISELKDTLRPSNKLIDKMVNKLWPGRVTRSPSAFNSYIIEFASTSEDVNNPKKVHLTFHSDESFWRNTCQLRPLWYHAEKSLQGQGHHVVPINTFELLQMSEAEEYVKYRVEKSQLFQDLSSVV